jgi:hypothetical protein
MNFGNKLIEVIDMIGMLLIPGTMIIGGIVWICLALTNEI